MLHIEKEDRLSFAVIEKSRPFGHKSNVMTNKKNKKKVAAVAAPKKIEMINIFKTTYGYWRYWVKNILADGAISKYRFVKDEGSYNGRIAVSKPDVDKAKKILADYKTKNPDTVEMWW